MARLRLPLLLSCLFLTVACGILPDEFNFSPIYRHRVDPDGNIAEFDLLWPLVHYERDETGATDVRFRPLWRRVATADQTRARHEFLVPLGAARSDPEEVLIRLLPLFWYREHLEEGRKDAWDRDWTVALLFWGGSSADGENYFAFFPVGGSIPQFLSYDSFSFALFPLLSWTQKGSASGTSILWPFIGWGGSEDRTRPHWFRVLPFYGESVYPGKSTSYTALWPFLHWGEERLGKKHPYSKFFLFPLFGWKSGGAFLSWTFLWPLFRHSHKVEGAEGVEGEFSSWDLPWPILHFLDNTIATEARAPELPLGSWDLPANTHQWWFMPLVASTRSRTHESLLFLYPLIWFRHFFDEVEDRRDVWLLPAFWDTRVRYKSPGGTPDEVTFEPHERRNLRVWPLAGWQESRAGDWRFFATAPWPFTGIYTTGVDEAYDWAWTLFETRGDARGNTRTRSFMNLWTSRTFAGKRYQCSVPLLFNYTREEDGTKTLRLLQFLPISWGGP